MKNKNEQMQDAKCTPRVLASVCVCLVFLQHSVSTSCCGSSGFFESFCRLALVQHDATHVYLFIFTLPFFLFVLPRPLLNTDESCYKTIEKNIKNWCHLPTSFFHLRKSKWNTLVIHIGGLVEGRETLTETAWKNNVIAKRRVVENCRDETV